MSDPAPIHQLQHRAASGLRAVEPAKRRRGIPPNYSTERARAAWVLLQREEWIGDHKRYPKRHQAKWQAESLIRALTGDGLVRREQLHMRTWPEGQGFKWAVGLRRDE